MKTLFALAAITGLLLLYALWGREWLKTKLWAQGFFAWIEPIEIVLFKKSETVLFGRLLQFLGVVLTGLIWVGSIDITPIIPLVPEKYQLYLQVAMSFMPQVLNGLGAIVERLRNQTTKPLELVAVPDKVIAETPRLAEAVAMADATKIEAVAVVVEAKAVAVAEAKAA
jgi:hypothetical protein